MSHSTDTVASRFTGKTAIVTGAGSGTGQATALRPTREGATVIAADISAARLEELTAGNPALPQVHDSDEARLLTLKGELLLEGFCLDFFYAGDAAADYMTRYATALSAIG
jgi:NAD(P)-dependent dehydrogenase (short-subunit alcohol dehydrogenase family)